MGFFFKFSFTVFKKLHEIYLKKGEFFLLFSDHIKIKIKTGRQVISRCLYKFYNKSYYTAKS